MKDRERGAAGVACPSSMRERVWQRDALRAAAARRRVSAGARSASENKMECFYSRAKKREEKNRGGAAMKTMNATAEYGEKPVNARYVDTGDSRRRASEEDPKRYARARMRARQMMLASHMSYGGNRYGAEAKSTRTPR